MLELKYAAQREDKEAAAIDNACSDLFNEWLFDLDSREKEIWLWNALVEMVRIRERRNNLERALCF